MVIYLALFLLFSFYFHFHSPLSFTCTLQILFDLVLHLLLYLIFVLLYLLSFLLLFIPRYLLSQKCWVKTNSFILFSSRHISIHVLILFFVYLKLLFFKFYLIAVLIPYLYFIIYRGAHVFGTMWRCLLWPSLLRVALSMARNEAWVVPETLCSPRWCVDVFLNFKSLVLVIFTFLSPLFVNLYIRNFLNTI